MNNKTSSKMNEEIKIVFSDFDDTLVKHTGLGRQILKEVLKKHNISFDEEKFSKLPHYNLQDKLKLFFPNEYELIWPEVDKEFTKRVVNETNIFPETLDFLKTLKEKNIPIIIVSTKFAKHIKNISKHNKIDHLILEIIGRETIDPPKPHAKGVNTILQKYKIDKKNAIYIGDSALDGENAKNADIRFVYIKRKATHEIIPTPWITITNLNEIIELL